MSRWRLRVVGCALMVAVALPARAQRGPEPDSASPAPATAEAVQAPVAPDALGNTPQPQPPGGPRAQPASPPADQPFKRVLPNFWEDLRRLPSLGTAVTLGTGGALSAVASRNDEYFTAHASAGGVDHIFKAGGALGAGYMQAGIAVGTYAIGRMTKHAPSIHLGTDLIRGQLLTGVLTHSLKAVTKRHRPTGEQDSTTDTYSFPSAHASATWTTSTVLWRHLGWKVGAPASLLAAYVSASRLQQNAHFMSDVLFGAALGIASARTVTIGHGDRQVAVSATPVAGGAAVTFNVVPK